MMAEAIKGPSLWKMSDWRPRVKTTHGATKATGWTTRTTIATPAAASKS